uniref:Uncharacterized protein n=1 Tax=Arundo donax TaxID=35708 RepID=A0A0A9FHQ5_ARUDO
MLSLGKLLPPSALNWSLKRADITFCWVTYMHKRKNGTRLTG